MKVLQINNVYKRGSTGKIVQDIHEILNEYNIDSIVCYGRGQKESGYNIYKVSTEILAKLNALKSRITGLQYNGSLIATNKLINIIKKEKPDIVHLQCINGYFVNIYRLMNYLKKKNINTVLTLHAEFMHTGGCGHAYDCEKWKTGCGNCPQLWIATKSWWFDRTHTAWEKMKEAFNEFDNIKIVAVSEWLKKRAEQSPIISSHNVKVIHNGIDTDKIFYPRTGNHIIEKYNLENKKIILHVTASFSLKETDTKGGRFIVELAKRLEKENVVFIVIGGRDQTITLPKNIINLGRINNQNELAEYYSIADLTVLTSKRETYSMVCVESLSCGTPVVGFRAGAPEMISIREFSEFVEYGDVEELNKIVTDWINVKSSISPIDISNKAHEKYSRVSMGIRYLELYSEFIKK